MKKNLTATLLGVMLLLNIILWFRTIALGQNIENLQRNMSNQFSHLSSEVRGISYDVSNTIERQASLFEDVSWAFGAVDAESLTIPLTVSAIPKEASTTTTATLTVNGASTQMTRDGLQFTGILPVGLFTTLDVYVTFDAESTQRSQQVATGLRPFEERLPTLFAQNAGGSSFEHNVRKFTLDGRIQIDLKAPENTTITSLKIVTTDNGTVIHELAAKPILDPPVYSQMVDYPLEITFEPNHTYETAVVATDGYGLTYRTIVDRHVIGADGALPDFGQMEWWGNTTILDKNGRVLYDPIQ